MYNLPKQTLYQQKGSFMFCAALTYTLHISSGGQTRRETREAGGSAGAGVR